VITPEEAAQLGIAATSFIKAINTEIPFLDKLDDEKKGNFIYSFSHAFIQTMAHNHWISEHEDADRKAIFDSISELLKRGEWPS